VRFAELAAAAFIKYKNDAFVAQFFHPRQVGLFADGRVEFLNGGDNQFGVVRKLFHQHIGVFGAVHAAVGKMVELPRGLVVEVVAVHHKHHFVHLRQFYEHLTCLERRERFARSRGVPDVTVFGAVEYPIYDGLGGVVLVGPQNHGDFVGFVQYDILAIHFRHVAFFQKRFGKRFEAGNGVVVAVGPVKRLLIRLPAVVGVVLRVHAVADHEQLHVLVQTVLGAVRMPVVTVHLVEGFFELKAPAFEFDLH